MKILKIKEREVSILSNFFAKFLHSISIILYKDKCVLSAFFNVLIGILMSPKEPGLEDFSEQGGHTVPLMRETRSLHDKHRATRPILRNFAVRYSDRTKVVQPWHRATKSSTSHHRTTHRPPRPLSLEALPAVLDAVKWSPEIFRLIGLLRTYIRVLISSIVKF